MDIQYKVNAAVASDQFINLLTDSTLGERRPVEDEVCMAGAIAGSNLVVTAWQGEQLVGMARSLTDFHYACYLSDLAVASAYQRQGIGKQLLRLSQQQLGPRCKIILLAAPAANDYYSTLGFTNNPRCWVLDRNVAVPE
ncbi:GNAT family N-acetyltransferase [Pseudomaricurvus sp. HS19]|uniref:GNAT family N-acetyltransferase n=1 Tax=Pseudomaricurvus sp. HS19 TaxID=2692626 RepID=UPI001367E106|nr:GNAT family N-acetyltransferase [Pseudomaricurvus sp. HS19]MYM62493.1 GNAT family N-acetyltransferase [Pseudomaricurvus sp. HS19]